MKRRSFLGVFSGAVAAPLMPVVPMAQAGYSQGAWTTAVAAARSRAALSVDGLARALNVSPATSEVLMRDMVKKGLLNPLVGPRHGGFWATSKVMRPGQIAALQGGSHAAKRKIADQAEASATDMIAHLRQLCAGQGIALSPRCLAGAV